MLPRKSMQQPSITLRQATDLRDDQKTTWYRPIRVEIQTYRVYGLNELSSVFKAVSLRRPTWSAWSDTRKGLAARPSQAYSRWARLEGIGQVR